MYIDFKLTEKYPNKYGFTPENIKTVSILDWTKLKKHTWFNRAKIKTGKWWCVLVGCNAEDQKYDDSDEFWIGFREDDNKVDCYFSSHEGMCGYNFKKFYDVEEIDNQYDMRVQANTIKYLNMLVDEGIISRPKAER